MLARMCEALTEAPRPDADARRAGASRRRPWPLDPDRRVCVRRSTASYGAYLDTERRRRGPHGDARPPGRRDRVVADPAARAAARPVRGDAAGASLDEHCPPNAHAEDWDLDALPRGVKERFGFEPDHRRAQDRSSARRWRRSLWSEIEKVIEAREAEFSLPRAAATSRATSTSRRSTRAGSTTSRRWRRCARASACAATARRIRSRSTRRKASRSSAR